MNQTINEISGKGTVLCLVDCPNSETGATIRKEFLNETLNIENKEVIVLAMDTVLRGEPVVINKNNVNKLKDSGIPIISDSKDFTECLKQALTSSVMKDKELGSVVFFTNTPDKVPTKKDFEEYLNKDINIYLYTTLGNLINLNVEDTPVNSSVRKNKM